MDELLADVLATAVPVLGRALLHFLWQGALIGAAAMACLHALRDARPQARYAVACLALLACVLAPVATLLAPVAAPAVAPLFAATAQVDEAARVSALSLATAPLATLDPQLPLIVAAWAIGTCLLSLRLALGLAWVRRVRTAPQPAAQGTWQARLDALAVNFDLPRRVLLRVVDGIDSPLAAGWWRPVVLLPAALVASMPVDLLEALLAHELAHVRRHDYLVNLLQHAVEALLFYHPVTWWLSRRIRIEREQVADRLAAEVACAPRRLALALSALADHQREHSIHPAAQLAPAAHGGHLMSRIRQLIRPDRHVHAGARLLFPLLGLAAACVATYGYAQIGTQPAHDDGGTQSIHVVEGDGRDSFALVSAHGKDVTMWGNVTHARGLEAARRATQGEFLWLRHDGADYVITDPAILARARAAWRDSERIGAQMEALGNEMEVHGAKMETIGERMEAASSDVRESREAEAVGQAMEKLGRRQEALGRKQEELAQRQEHARNDAEEEVLAREADALAQQQDELAAAQDRYAEQMDAESERMEARQGPMERLQAEMEEAGKPMEALGAKMDALGKQQDAASERADRDMRKLMDEAMANGLAKPLSATRAQ